MEELQRNNADDVFQKSESLSMILNKNLSFMLKHGMSILFSICILGLIATVFISVPDKIESQIKLSSNNSIKPIIALAEGRLIQLNVKDKDKVKKGDLIAKIANLENDVDIVPIENSLLQLQSLVDNGLFSQVANFQLIKANYSKLQPLLEPLNQSLDGLKIAIKNNGFAAKRNIIENRLSGLITMNRNLTEQEKLYANDLKLAQENYETQTQLYNQKATSLTELKTHESQMTVKQLALKQIQSQIISNQNAQNDIREQLLDIDKGFVEQKNKISYDVRNAIAAITDIKSQNYIYAPEDGEISFNKPLSQNDFIKPGEALFNIIPKENKMIGIMSLSQNNFGKLAVGKDVKVKFDGYNFMEYGIVLGKVISISETPIENNYLVKIEFPNDLKTNQNKNIVFKNGLTGTGTIILKETKLLYKLISFKNET